MSRSDFMTSGAEFVHTWDYDGRTITFSWIGKTTVAPSRVYGFAFTAEGRMLLVGGGADVLDYWLPGGGIEAGEDLEAALARELDEEAAATVLAMQYIGAQKMEEPGVCEYHAFYWRRIKLADEYAPQLEIKERRLVAPEEFLDVLFWGRSDPKAKMLLDAALDLERRCKA
jgi:ADP-ribose pyrophosphatase YjhB (NUDIX family)